MTLDDLDKLEVDVFDNCAVVWSESPAVAEWLYEHADPSASRVSSCDGAVSGVEVNLGGLNRLLAEAVMTADMDEAEPTARPKCEHRGLR